MMTRKQFKAEEARLADQANNAYLLESALYAAEKRGELGPQTNAFHIQRFMVRR